MEPRYHAALQWGLLDPLRSVRIRAERKYDISLGKEQVSRGNSMACTLVTRSEARKWQSRENLSPVAFVANLSLQEARIKLIDEPMTTDDQAVKRMAKIT